MSVLQKSNRRASARDQIDVEGVKSGVLMLPRGRYRAVLSVSPVNFELKSEEERDAIIDTYESFLNSVGCPLQILVRTREIDLDKYLAGLGASRQSETVAVYRDQLKSYGDFIRGLVSTNRILTRNFYVVVPHASNGKLDFDGVKEQLGLKADIVRRGLTRLGIASRRLGDLELLDLFYSFYSPEQSKLQPLSSLALDLLNTEYVKKGEQ